jgi:TonB-dependent SusC/RagA subfamily outer membrane receptor
VTGAVDSLSGKSLEQQHAEDVAALLQTRVPGLQVVRGQNGDISLRIRGGDYALRAGEDGSITATQDGEPLLVIDGMPVQDGQLGNALRALRPHDIQSIKVLKDVSSTAFYGIRGAHGVILITTKRD